MEIQKKQPQKMWSGFIIVSSMRFQTFPPLRWNGKVGCGVTSEHAYQAAKFLENAPEIAEEIHEARSAHEAKKVAHKHEDKVADGFHDKNVSIMKDICQHKLR